MLLQKRTFNPKRQLCPEELISSRRALLLSKLNKLRYTGNPEHKRRPGDFGLIPPGGARPGKTLCDAVGIFSRAEALSLLRAGVERGAFSLQEREGWPQNVWAVTEEGDPLEAQLEGTGAYHGYPMPEADPFRDRVLERWKRT